MIDSLIAAFLGLVQGLTEFLPVSSSGHLVLSQQLLSRCGFPVEGDDLFLDVLLHLGTLAVVLGYYRREILQCLQEWTGLGGPVESTLAPGCCRYWTYCVLLSTLLTGAIAMPLEGHIETAFTELLPAGLGLLLTGTLLLVTVNHQKKTADPENSGRDLTLAMAAVIGLGQAVSVFPGVSRSGTTIAVALILGMRRREAVTYSFLLSIPAIVGGTLLHARKVDSIEWTQPLVGMTVAALAGWVALRWLVNSVLQGKLLGFSYYCYAVGAITLVLAFLSP